MTKVLFLTKDKKFYYDDGKIKEVKNIKDLNGVEIRFARAMLVYDTDLPLSYFVEELGNVTIGNYTLSQLTQLLYFRNSIVFVDHEKKKIQIFLEKKEIIELPYSSLDFLRYYFAKIGRILLESVSFDYFEALSDSEINKSIFTNKTFSQVSTTMSRPNFNSLRRKLINNIINVLSFGRKQMKST
ncbi:hypothetical protein SJAV_16730 [Sulfurisphaera javensis]|uniref:Uncharacterized protein n=1 Tax=Sulfurisphaera javensis TaxID=2049879 RepID=A0AAT9GS81_9CREN